MTHSPQTSGSPKALSARVVLSARWWPPPLGLKGLESLVLFPFTVPLRIGNSCCSSALVSQPFLCQLGYSGPSQPVPGTHMPMRWGEVTHTQCHKHPSCSNSKGFLPALCYQDRIPGAQGRESNLSLAGLGSLSFAAEEKGNLGLLFRFCK